MDGVTILNTFTATQGFHSVLGIVFIVVGAIFGANLGSTFTEVGSGWKILLKNTLICASIFAVFIGCVFGIYTTINPYREIPRYEVTISEDVNLQEFEQKYEIIEQRGKIYVIQEKEVEEK